MQAAWALIDGHEAIQRKVEEIPDGVRTVTTTADPELVPVLQQHVADMASLLESGGRIRNWDPLFAEIFDQRDAIEIEIENLDNGVAVTETSADPEVVKLIRAHARKVDQFVARDGAAYREATPLPEDYGAGGR